MSANSVHIIVVSPPYYDKRVYNVPPTEWPPVMYSPMPGIEPIIIPGCDPTCKHDWKSEGRMQKPLAHSKKSTLAGGYNPRPTKKGKYKGETKPKPLKTYICQKCGGWKGALGHEPTVEMYTAHQIAIYRHARRVLRPDGIFFLNIDDSYAGSGGPGGDFRVKGGDVGGRKYRRGSLGKLRRKNKMGVPWRVAFALQAEGWVLRNDNIWRKTNPSPDNPDDRFAHCFEYVFMFADSDRYYFDNIAVRLPHKRDWGEEEWAKRIAGGQSWSPKAEEHADPATADRFVHHGSKTYAQTYDPAGARRKDVWEFATAQTDDAHFAAFPEALPEICILAGTSAFGVCLTCGAQWARVLEEKLDLDTEKFVKKTVGWAPTCNCPLPPDHRRLEDCVRPATVLDFFAGTGTTLETALKVRRSGIGVELNPDYARMMSQNTEVLQYGMFLDLDL